MLLCLGAPAFAQTPAAGPPAATAPQQADQQQIRDEVDRLRKEFESIRDSYGARLTALEAKLGTATLVTATTPVPPVAPLPEAAPAPAQQAQQPAAPQQPAGQAAGVDVPSGAAGAGGPQGALPVYGGGTASSKVFNPDMAVIGNFIGTTGENKIESAPSLEMHEAEVTFQAVVDPYARADVFLSASPDGLEIEEGFLTLTSLPGGLLAKVGKMKEQFGKANTMHAHTLPWVDVPIVMKNFLGGEEGPQRFRRFGLEAAHEPAVLPGSDGRGLPGQLRTVSDPRAQRRQLAGPAARVSRHHRGNESRCRRVVHAGPQRRRTGFHDAADSAWTRPIATGRSGAPFIAGSWPGPS